MGSLYSLSCINREVIHVLAPGSEGLELCEYFWNCAADRGWKDFEKQLGESRGCVGQALSRIWTLRTRRWWLRRRWGMCYRKHVPREGGSLLCVGRELDNTASWSDVQTAGMVEFASRTWKVLPGFCSLPIVRQKTEWGIERRTIRRNQNRVILEILSLSTGPSIVTVRTSCWQLASGKAWACDWPLPQGLLQERK